MTELARNICPEPLFASRSTEGQFSTPAVSWTDGSGYPLSIGGKDRWGYLAPELQVELGSTNGDGAAVPVTVTPGQTYMVTVTVLPNSSTGTAAQYWGASFTAGAFTKPKDEGVWGNFTGTKGITLTGLLVAAEGDTHFRVRGVPTTGPTHRITGCRITHVGSGATEWPDDYGIFDGDTPDTDDVAYQWEGTPYASESVAVVPVEPDPTPTPSDLAGRVAAYLNRPGDPETIALATAQLPVVTAYVYGYTRGRGFNPDGVPALDLEHVIIAATAFLTTNPEQVTYYAAGDYSERPAVLTGWTLPQLSILNRYRRRYA